MLPLPQQCEQCPFYKYKDATDNGFVPDTLVEGSEVMFYGQNPGVNEIHGRKLIKRHYIAQGLSHDEYTSVKPAPLLGATGQLFNNKFLPLTGLTRGKVSIGNAIRCRPGSALGLKADELPTITNKMNLESSKAEVVAALRHCKQAHFKPPASVKLIVTMGQFPLYQLTGQTSVNEWRGYALSIPRDPHRICNTPVDSYSHVNLVSQDNVTVFSTMHIAALYKGENKKYYHATLQDFNKIKLLLSATWPLSLPSWSDTPPTTWPSYAAFDTEYTMASSVEKGNELIRWSLCGTDNSLYCIEAYNTSLTGIPIAPGSTVLMQNALADIGHLATIVDMSRVKVEDLMLAHSVLWTGEPHSLNYIASIYGAFNRYKHLSHDQEQLYSALDAYEPMHIWRSAIIPQMKQDPQSWKVYKKYTLPLIPIINKAQLTGVKLNSERLREAHLILQQRVESLKKQAREITGDIHYNLGSSKRTKELIYGIPAPVIKDEY